MKNVEIVKKYFNALQRGDLETVNKCFSDDLVWHQPGKGTQSGVYKGKNNVFAHLGNLIKWSGGSFGIDQVDYITDNGDLVAASIHFTVKKGVKQMEMRGIDLLRLKNGFICEVWLFSERIDEEDAFWTELAKG